MTERTSSAQSRGANRTGTRAAKGSSKRALFRNTTAGRKTTRACSGTRPPVPLFPLCVFRNTADHASRALASIGQGTKCYLRVCKCSLCPCRLLLPSLLFARRRHLGGADGGGQGQCAHAPQRKHTRRPTTLPPHDVHHLRRRLKTHPTCIDIPASLWEPGSSPPSRACRGGCSKGNVRCMGYVS